MTAAEYSGSRSVPASAPGEETVPSSAQTSVSEVLGSLRGLISAYVEKVEELERNRKPFEGIFGLKGGPKDDPCHDRFAEDVQALVDSFAQSAPSSHDAHAVLYELFSAAPTHRNTNSAYWMLLAVLGTSFPLIDHLDPSDAAELRDFFVRTYPRRELLPAQIQILKKLRGRAASA